MSVPQAFAIGGAWPLGTITITSGTAIQMTTNVGSQQQGQGVTLQAPAGRLFSANCRQLVFSTPAANTGAIYVNYGKVTGQDANATLLVVNPGQTTSLPFGGLCEDSVIDITQYWIDGSHSGDKVSIAAIDASS